MTLRRVDVILRGLPATAPVWQAVARAQAAAVDNGFMSQLRAAQAKYDKQRLGQRR